MIDILLFDVMIFYLTILGIIVFLLFSRMVSFKTLRERAGYGGNMRYQIDFLDFCKNDIHWFLVMFTLTMLKIFSLFKGE